MALLKVLKTSVVAYMRDQELRIKLAEIRSALAIKDSQIVANPIPYLNEMSSRTNEILKLLDDVEHALSPDYIFDYWSAYVNKDMIPRPIDLQGEALLRCNKAIELIQNYRYKK